MTSLTKEAVAALGVKPRDADRSKNFFALGLISWLYSRPTEPDARVDRQALRQQRAGRGGQPGGVPRRVQLRRDGRAVRPPVRGRSRRRSTAGDYTNITATPRWPGAWWPPASGPACRCSSAATRSRRRRDILHELSKHKNFGVRTFQAEDEIAAIGSALGAAFGGQLGITTTSGPGVALKSETISLAVSLELPLLIVDIQRGWPVDRAAHQDRGRRPQHRPLRAPFARRRCPSWPPTARRTASRRPSRRPAWPSSTARR